MLFILGELATARRGSAMALGNFGGCAACQMRA